MGTIFLWCPISYKNENILRNQKCHDKSKFGTFWVKNTKTKPLIKKVHVLNPPQITPNIRKTILKSLKINFYPVFMPSKILKNEKYYEKWKIGIFRGLKKTKAP